MEISEKDRFKKTLVEFSQRCLDIYNDCYKRRGEKHEFGENFIVVVGDVLSGKDGRLLITQFIVRSYKYWDTIKLKNEKFFINNADIIFNEIPDNYIKQFKKLFENNLLDDDDKECIWAFVFSLVKISIKYLHLHPKFCMGNNIDNKSMSTVGKQWGINEKWFKTHIPKKIIN